MSVLLAVVAQVVGGVLVAVALGVRRVGERLERQGPAGPLEQLAVAGLLERRETQLVEAEVQAVVAPVPAGAAGAAQELPPVRAAEEAPRTRSPVLVARDSVVPPA
jgi:hypothetical protein